MSADVPSAQTPEPLDIDESVLGRAVRNLAAFLTTVRGFALWGLVSAAGGLAGTAWAPESWAPAWRVAVGFVIVLAAVLTVGSVIATGHAVTTQRDAARTRLRLIRDAAQTFALAPREASTVPIENDVDVLLRVLIENQGRAARFAPVLEDLDGTQQPLVDPFAPLYWMARPGVIAEEIPAGESRLVGVAVIEDWGKDGYSLTPLSPTGERYSRSYTLQRGKTTVLVRVSTWGLDELTYVRRLNVIIDWDGQPGGEYSVYVGVDPDPPEERYFAAGMGRLLEF